MTEGDVVVVGVKLNERVREQSGVAIGTLIDADRDQAWVLLSTGDIWVGRMKEIYPYQDGLEEERIAEREYEEVS